MTARPQTGSLSPAELFAQKVARIARNEAAGLPTWWRRTGFVDPRVLALKPRAKPKWHVLASREGQSGTLYTALCGYSYEFGAEALAAPSIRDEIRTPSLQCSRCARALAAQGRAQQDPQHSTQH